ncbi:MAG: cupin domain-containing protein [Thiomicrospira sp.]|jgi:quercetin dioxygenase-like cupin family protein|nr:cupin domain-containing protein [Thiomicrospira sp.]
MRRMLWIIGLSVWGLNAYAFKADNGIQVTPLLKSTTSWEGTQIQYPDGEAEISGLMVEIAPGAETGWHYHPVSSFGYMLSGELEITTEHGQVKRTRAGEAMVEVANILHNGRNVGSEPVKIIVFYAGAKDVPLTIHQAKQP